MPRLRYFLTADAVRHDRGVRRFGAFGSPVILRRSRKLKRSLFFCRARRAGKPQYRRDSTNLDGHIFQNPSDWPSQFPAASNRRCGTGSRITQAGSAMSFACQSSWPCRSRIRTGDPLGLTVAPDHQPCGGSGRHRQQENPRGMHQVDSVFVGHDRHRMGTINQPKGILPRCSGDPIDSAFLRSKSLANRFSRSQKDLADLPAGFIGNRSSYSFCAIVAHTLIEEGKLDRFPAAGPNGITGLIPKSVRRELTGTLGPSPAEPRSAKGFRQQSRGFWPPAGTAPISQGSFHRRYKRPPPPARRTIIWPCTSCRQSPIGSGVTQRWAVGLFFQH